MSVLSFLETLLGSRTLANVKGVKWQDREWGEMMVSRAEVCIQQKHSTFGFGTRTNVGLRIPIVLVASHEINSDHQIIIHWIDPDDNPLEEVITFKKQGDAGVITAALGRALKELGEESKRAQLERIERIQRQKEERQRQEESRRVQEERVVVWKTTGQVWEMVLELNRITLALPGEDWNTIDTSWRKMNAIAQKCVLDLSLGIDSFMPSLESKSADEMYKDVLNFIKLLGDAIKAVQITRMEEEELARRYESFPQWCHIPYFLLFALTYTDTMLANKAGDTDTTTENLSRLTRVSPVLLDEFGMNLEQSIYLFSAGLETGDPDQVKATGKALEDHISEVFEITSGTN